MHTNLQRRIFSAAVSLLHSKIKMCLVILTSPHPSATVINQNANFYVMIYEL